MSARLHLETRGPADGRPVVFLHSLGGSSAHWRDVIDGLPPGILGIALDLRGHGRSPVPAPPYGLAEAVEDLAAALDALGVDRCVVVGCSVGGLVAQGFALAHPAHLDGLVLCNTEPRLGTIESWSDRIAAIEQSGLAALAPAFVDRWFSDRFKQDHPNTIAQAAAALQASPQDGYLGTCALLRDTDLWPLVAGIAVPTRVVAGGHDIVVPPASVRRLADALPRGRYAEIADAGHLPHLDSPASLGALIRTFLVELDYAKAAA